MSAIDRLQLNRAALIVVDLQNAFCHPEGTLGQSGLDTERLGAIIPRLRPVILRCHEVGIPVLWTLQEHFADDRRRARKQLPSHTSKRKGVSALAGSWDAQIVDQLKDLVTNPSFLIRKHRFGGFYETRMDIVLQQLGVDAVFVTGSTTNACVETTIREAYLRDYDVVGITDLISGVNTQWEETAHKIWRQYFGVTIDSSEFNGWIDRQLEPAATAIHHLLLKVSDLDRSISFYVNYLGFTERADAKPLPDGRRFVSLSQGLGLTEGGPGDRGQVDHIAFEVRNVTALNRKLKALGVTFERELGQGPYGKAIYIKDPDGNILELFEKQGA
jgi:ureidoacrylate peracid hydrolase